MSCKECGMLDGDCMCSVKASDLNGKNRGIGFQIDLMKIYKHISDKKGDKEDENVDSELARRYW